MNTDRVIATEREKNIVIGFGNPLAGDEGIGPAILEKLPEFFDCSPVECLDLGTSGFALIHALEGRKTVVIVDCAFMDELPGVLRRFGVKEAQSVKEFSHFSLHEGDVFDIIRIASEHLAGEMPEIIIIGIEPERIGFGTTMSSTLAKKIPEYCSFIAALFKLLPKTKKNA